MSAHDHVDQRERCSDVHVDGVADMGEQDDLVDPGGVERFGRAADILDDVGEFDIVAREAMSGVSSVVAPMMPTFSPPMSRTMEPLILRRGSGHG